MEAWYKVATPRKEVRQGRSFNPDEFAIHLEQVLAKTAPEDYREPEQFFARTCFTRALREHAGTLIIGYYVLEPDIQTFSGIYCKPNTGFSSGQIVGPTHLGNMISPQQAPFSEFR